MGKIVTPVSSIIPAPNSGIYMKLFELARLRRNVLMFGDHGIGKTEVYKGIMNELGLKSLYFSASTLDPYCDLVGIPSPELDKVLKKKVLKYIRDNRLEDAEVMMFDEANRCLTGETEIQLANGTNVKIKDLVGVDQFYVFSYDIKTNQIKIGRGHSARKTSTNRKVYKITLSNGKTIRATDNHPFLMSNNQYTNVEDLKVGDTVKALTPDALTVVSIEEDGFEDVYDITVDDYHNFALEAGNFVHNSHPKVRNAIFEIIQFKEINGIGLPNLKMCWAACNNPDAEMNYAVEELDPAFMDRFHQYVMFTADPVAEVYVRKGIPAWVAKRTIAWWKGLGANVKRWVTPRRLEYIMRDFCDGIDLNGTILPTKLMTNVKDVPLAALIESLNFKGEDEEVLEIMRDYSAAWMLANYEEVIQTSHQPGEGHFYSEAFKKMNLTDLDSVVHILDKCPNEFQFTILEHFSKSIEKNLSLVREKTPGLADWAVKTRKATNEALVVQSNPCASVPMPAVASAGSSVPPTANNGDQV